jgi:hypothetical protein
VHLKETVCQHPVRTVPAEYQQVRALHSISSIRRTARHGPLPELRAETVRKIPPDSRRPITIGAPRDPPHSDRTSPTPPDGGRTVPTRPKAAAPQLGGTQLQRHALHTNAARRPPRPARGTRTPRRRPHRISSVCSGSVAADPFASYVTGKPWSRAATTRSPTCGPGRDTHVGFGLANPAIYSLLTDPSSGLGQRPPAAGMKALRARVHRVATIGRLRVSDRRAVELIHAAGTGAVLTPACPTPATARAPSAKV